MTASYSNPLRSRLIVARIHTFNDVIVPVDGGIFSGMIRLCPEFFSHSVPVGRWSVPALRRPARRTPGLRCFALAPLRLPHLGSY